MSGAIEIKDRTSNVRMSLNAQGAAFIDTIDPIDVVVTSPTTFPVSGTVNSVATQNPAITGMYGFGVADAAGVVAANNFLTIFNPVGSGKNIILTGAFVSSYQVGDAATSVVSMRAYRITSSTGGSLAAASAILKFSTSYANTVAELRSGNPTVTLGAGLFVTPPPIGAAKGGTPTTQAFVPAGGSPPLLLQEGEGVLYRTEAGDVDQRWNIGFTWAEV